MIEFTKDELEWIKKIVNGHFEFCERYHPHKDGVSIDIYIEDEDIIRSIKHKIEAQNDKS